MSLGIGIVVYTLLGTVCLDQNAALEYVQRGSSKGCAEDITLAFPLMPQAVVAKTDKYKVVRLGTVTDPVENLWLVIPADQKVTGEPVD